MDDFKPSKDDLGSPGTVEHVDNVAALNFADENKGVDAAASALLSFRTGTGS